MQGATKTAVNPIHVQFTDEPLTWLSAGYNKEQAAVTIIIIIEVNFNIIIIIIIISIGQNFIFCQAKGWAPSTRT